MPFQEKIYRMYKNDVIISKISKSIFENEMLSQGSRVVVALSGGSDSMCLLDALLKLSEFLEIKVECAHVNHSIRGKDSDSDEDFVKEYCAGKKVPVKSIKVDAKKYSKMNKISLENAARILRYEFLNTIANEKNTVIAVAHHMDDQAETILLNLIRGSGTAGLAGMSPVFGKIIRPMLDCTKLEIENYIRKNNIPFCVDKTNLELDAQRNKVRLKLIPELESVFGFDVKQSLCRTATLCKEDEMFLSSYTRDVFNKYYTKGAGLSCGIISTSDFAVSSRLIRMLYESIKGDMKNLTFKQVGALIKLCKKPSEGKKADISDGYCGWIRDNNLIIESKEKYSKYILDLNSKIRNSKNIMAEFKTPMDTGKIFSKVQIFSKFVVNDEELVYNAKTWCFPVEVTDGAVLRYRMQGDRIRPNRNSGSKLLKDFFTDRRVSLSLRDEMVVLAKGSDILWVCGVGGIFSGPKPDIGQGKKIVRIWCKSD